MDDWIDFYDSAHTIYVNARHRDLHFLRIAHDLAGHVPAGATVLDYGCGEAIHADVVAARAGRLILCEPAPGVRARLAEHWHAAPNIEVCAPDALAALPDHSVDVVIMHSVAQYLTPEELDAALALFRRLIRAGGLLLVGDVIKPETPALTDALALLRFGAREGFFFAAIIGLGRTVLSPYWQLRSSLGLTRYDEPAIVAKLAAAGFSAGRTPANIGHNSARMTFLARPRGVAAHG